jgi:hypothetical protein
MSSLKRRGVGRIGGLLSSIRSNTTSHPGDQTFRQGKCSMIQPTTRNGIIGMVELANSSAAERFFFFQVASRSVPVVNGHGHPKCNPSRSGPGADEWGRTSARSTSIKVWHTDIKHAGDNKCSRGKHGYWSTWNDSFVQYDGGESFSMPPNNIFRWGTSLMWCS